MYSNHGTASCLSQKKTQSSRAWFDSSSLHFLSLFSTSLSFSLQPPQIAFCGSHDTFRNPLQQSDQQIWKLYEVIEKEILQFYWFAYQILQFHWLAYL